MKNFLVREGEKVDLKKWPTKVSPLFKSKKEYRTLLADHIAELSAQQNLLYAADSYALLLIFQAMDAAGKDGAIKHVMSGINPQGCEVYELQASQRGGTGSRFPVAHHAATAGARADRDFQSLLLRGSADRAGASGDSSRGAASARTWKERISGRTGIVPSWIWKSICIAMERSS